MRLLMIRHGEIPSNINKVYAGKSRERLTQKGIHQAREVALKLRHYDVDALYTSPIQRAKETADIIADTIDIPCHTMNSLRELELGPWEGLSENEIARLYPEEWQTWNIRPKELTLPGRETLDELLKRVLSGITRLTDDMNDKNTIMVTHVAIIRVMLLWHQQKSLNLYKKIPVPNAEIFEIEIDKKTALKI